MEKIVFSEEFEKNEKMLDGYFRTDINYDTVATRLYVGQKRAKLYFIDGFIDGETSERVMNSLMHASKKETDRSMTADEFAQSLISYVEIEISDDINRISKIVYSGAMLMIVDGFSTSFLIKTRSYPKRSVQEPDNDRVLRGAHDGFVESLLINTSLIRRRIRDRDLIIEVMQAGEKSKTDIAICYLNSKVNRNELKGLKNKINAIDVNTLNMSQESLAECLLGKQGINPFPKVRFTERPDSSAAGIAEGSIIVLVDNSPAAMIIPTSFFEFFQDANDYYFMPVVGTYFRFVRGFIFTLAMLLSPIWYLLIKNPQLIPQWLNFITVKEYFSVPILAQLLVIEIVIDTLKMASLNTPNSLSNSFSVISALVLGDLAVGANLFSPEVVLIMAFVAIANFAQPSLELGYAFKLSRIMLLILTGILNIKGFVIGFLIIALTLCLTKTITGRNYLYPLIPFDAKALGRLIIRRSISKDNS